MISGAKIPRARNGLTREQMELKLEVAESIASLKRTNSWAAYEKAIEVLIQQSDPDVRNFTPEMAVKIASDKVYCSGIRAAINLVNQAAKEAETLRAQLDKP